MSVSLDKVIGYHEASKHHYHAYAPGPGSLDWASQPDPFRRYAGAQLLTLPKFPSADGPFYDQALVQGRVQPAALTRETIARLLYDSVALSAWKQAGDSRWALRVNPSSGNLHPTETYLVSGPVAGLLDTPAVCHYTPLFHALEVRTSFAAETWRQLIADFPEQTFLIGLSSIYWREAWKYGVRAFRYCQHDTGHAIAAVGFAAAALGWKASLLDESDDDAVGGLLGLPRQPGPEAERPECLLAIYPQAPSAPGRGLSRAAISGIARGEWRGTANALSAAHRAWPMIDDVDRATRTPDSVAPPQETPMPEPHEPDSMEESPLLRRLIHQRRSAVAMDGRTGLRAAGFYSMMQRCLPGARRFPFNAWPWSACVHLLIFVHRVQDVPPGFYILVRNPTKEAELRASFAREFDWSRPDGCPPELPLYRLTGADCRKLAERVSCHQEIAADGIFAVAMLAEFEAPLTAYGPWFYRRLYWECGVIGQLLYLEAEAYGIQATGIGCFFDDPVHELLGLKGRRYQDLYHFTVGGGVAVARLMTLPPYPEPGTPTERT